MDVKSDDYIEYDVGDFYYHKLLAKMNKVLLSLRDEMNAHFGEVSIKVPRSSTNIVSEVEDYLKGLENE